MDIILTNATDEEDRAVAIHFNSLGYAVNYVGDCKPGAVRSFLFKEPVNTVVFHDVPNAYILSLLMAGVTAYREWAKHDVRAIYVSSTNLFNNCYDESIQQTQH